MRQAYIARINEVQDNFHAVAEVNPDALQIAAGLDVERSRGIIRGSVVDLRLALLIS